MGDALTHPWRLSLVVPTAIWQLLLWLLPVGFLPLRRPRWMLALIVAGLPLLLSSWGGILQPWWHHAAFLVPLIVGGALETIGRNSRRAQASAGTAGKGPSHSRELVSGLVAALAVASPFAFWAPDQVRLATAITPPSPADRYAVDAVGADEHVSAPNQIAAQLAHRTDVYIWSCPFTNVPSGGHCSHPNLALRINRIDLIVLPGVHDLSHLTEGGPWTVTYHNGVTIARRTGPAP